MRNKKHKCGECECWAYDKDGWGRCEAHAPHPSVMAEDRKIKFTLVWPMTKRDDGCHNDFRPMLEEVK